MPSGYCPEINCLEEELNKIPAGEPVLLFQNTDFDEFVFLYTQPENEVHVQYEECGERIGDQISIYEINLTGLNDPVYRVWHTSRQELEEHKVSTEGNIYLTSDTEWDDDISIVYGKESLLIKKFLETFK